MHINSSYELPAQFTDLWFMIMQNCHSSVWMCVGNGLLIYFQPTEWKIYHVANMSLTQFETMKIKCSDKWFKCSNFCQINIVCGLALSKQRRQWTMDEEWKVSCNILSFELSRYRSIALLISFYRKSHENFKCGLFVCGQIRYNYFFTQLLA